MAENFASCSKEVVLDVLAGAVPVEAIVGVWNLFPSESVKKKQRKHRDSFAKELQPFNSIKASDTNDSMFRSWKKKMEDACVVNFLDKLKEESKVDLSALAKSSAARAPVSAKGVKRPRPA
jgi:hypothetical protein